MYRISELKISILFIILIFLSSCNDFFVKDITGETVSLLSPSNGVSTIIQTQQFKWNEVEGADSYQIQVAYPDFNNVQYYLLDSVVFSTEFYFTLNPGTYEWRVRAKNFGGNSQYSEIWTITVDTSSDLTQQVVTLNYPTNNNSTNDSTPTFSWQSIYAATSYSIIIKNGNNWNTGSVLFSDTITSTSYTLDIINNLAEGTYCWAVKAINSVSSSQYYSPHILNIDLTDPPTLIPTLPSNQSSETAGIISFSWTRLTDLGSAPTTRTDSLYIYSDTLLINLFDRIGSTSSSAVRTINSSGWYKWYIISYDAAGNFSDTSIQRTFQIN